MEWLLYYAGHLSDNYFEFKFSYYCSTSNLTDAKRLLQTHPEINSSVINNSFWCACMKGHLEVAQWLLLFKPDINNSIRNERIFSYVCFKGDLEAAKCLLYLIPDINISVNNEAPFRMACKHGHLDVAQWLLSLKPYLYVLIYNKKTKSFIYKIRSKEEVNWEKRKCALHMALQEQTNILYQLPTDIAKSVTLFV